MCNSILIEYVNSRLHVALSLWAFCSVTTIQQGVALPFYSQLSIFSFGWLGYQYFHSLLPFITKNGKLYSQNILSLITAFVLGCYGLKNQSFSTLLVFIFVGTISFFYLLPFKKNTGLRYIPSIKIFIVALCWSVLATFSFYKKIDLQFFLVASKSIIWILVLIIPFEIHDIDMDDIKLKTMPQILGVLGVKNLCYSLILIIAFLSYLSNTLVMFWVEIIILLITGCLILKQKTNVSKYFISIRIESLPILWLILSYASITYF